MYATRSSDDTVPVKSKHVSSISIVQHDVFSFEVVAETTAEPITLGYAVTQPEAQKLRKTFIRALKSTN